MASVLYELKDCVVADTGEVIVKYKHFAIERLLARKPTKGLKVERLSYAERVVAGTFSHLPNLTQADPVHHNQHCKPERMIEIGELDGVSAGPPAESFKFNLPDEYLSLDLPEVMVALLEDKFPGLPAPYVERMMLELDMMHERQMDDFIRSLIYMVDTWDAHQIVHGVGRGSACASLVLYLIGVHLVDPIEYEIPIEEFLR